MFCEILVSSSKVSLYSWMADNLNRKLKFVVSSLFNFLNYKSLQFFTCFEMCLNELSYILKCFNKYFLKCLQVLKNK